MPTIVDRCQRFDFQRPAPEQIAEVLRRVAAAESIEIADGAVAAVARAASGSFRDALGTLDQLVAYGGKRIETDDVLAVLGVADSTLILAAAEAIAAGDGRATLEVSERLARSGRDVAQFGRDLLAHLRQLLVRRAAGDAFGEDELAAADPERMQAQAEEFTDLGLTRAIDAVAAALSAIREGDEPRMTMELALLRAARPQLDPTREAFAQRLERLEQAQGAGEAPPAKVRDVPAAPASEEPDAGAEDEPKAEVDLEKLIGLWPAVMDQVRDQGSELLSHALSVARPVAVNVEEAVLQVGFPASAGFNKRKAEAGDAKAKLADAVKTIVGERLRPVYVLLEGEHDDAEAATGEGELSPDELFEQFKDAFDGEEFEVSATADAGDAGTSGMDAGLDAGSGIDTGEAAA
jgi:DNA polymerase-3 subunit gamma/tau